MSEISDYVNSQKFRAAAEAGSALDFPLLVMRRRSKDLANSLLGVMMFRSVSLLYVGMVLFSLAIGLTQVWLRK